MYPRALCSRVGLQQEEVGGTGRVSEGRKEGKLYPNTDDLRWSIMELEYSHSNSTSGSPRGLVQSGNSLWPENGERWSTGHFQVIVFVASTGV